MQEPKAPKGPNCPNASFPHLPKQITLLEPRLLHTEWTSDWNTERFKQYVNGLFSLLLLYTNLETDSSEIKIREPGLYCFLIWFFLGEPGVNKPGWLSLMFVKPVDIEVKTLPSRFQSRESKTDIAGWKDVFLYFRPHTRPFYETYVNMYMYELALTYRLYAWFQ